MTINALTIVCFCLLLLTGIGIIVYDFKIQLIPILLITSNYILSIIFLTKFSVLYSFIFGIIGVIIILFLYFKKLPVDILFVIIILSFMIMYKSKWHIISAIIALIFIFIPIGKKEKLDLDTLDEIDNDESKQKLSFMIPLELVIIFEVCLMLKGVI